MTATTWKPSYLAGTPYHACLFRVATSGAYKFEFAFIRTHSRDAFQNVSSHGFGAPATCFQVITSVLGSLKTHVPVLCGLAGGPREDGAVLLDIAMLSLPR